MVLGHDTEVALLAKPRAVTETVELPELDDPTGHFDPESLMASPRGELGGIQQRLQESLCASAAVSLTRVRWGRVRYRDWPVKRLES